MKTKQILSVFSGKQKWKLLWMLFIIIINAIVELVGVSIILPFINIVVQPEMLMEKWYVKEFVKVTGFNQTQIIISLCITIVFVYFLKNAFVIYMSDAQLKFSYDGQRELSNSFMKYYLYQDYPFHLKHNSAELMRDIAEDATMFYAAVLEHLHLISEFVVCAVLVVFLLITDWAITIGVALFLSLMPILFLRKYKAVLERLGNERRYYSYKMTQSMQEAFGGVKEIKISENEQYFQNAFEDANYHFTWAFRKNLFLNAIPKPFMEAVCILGLMTIIGIKIVLGTDSRQFVGTLGVFGVAVFRLLPAINRISTCISLIMHNGVVVEGVCQRVENSTLFEKANVYHKDETSLSFNEKIEVKNLTFSYQDIDGSDDNHCILENVSIDIPCRKSVAFIGPSGAGKTTFVDLILGLLTPQEGQVLVDGVSINDHLKAWRNDVGYIPQTIYMLDDSIRNNIAFGQKIDDARIWSVLNQAQLGDFVRQLPEGLDTVIGEAGTRLSGGQRQRIGIARALYREPEVLVLDEATSALDNETEAAVMEAIETLQGKITLIIIAHRLSTISKCDEVYEVSDRKVIKK